MLLWACWFNSSPGHMIHKKSCGIVPVYKGESGNLYLIVHQTNDVWCFPKGGQDEGENDQDTAMRELREETGIIDIDVADGFEAIEKYRVTDETEPYSKEIHYFLGFVENKDVTPQENEIQGYKWATFEEANKHFQFESTKTTLQKAHQFLLK